jgi:hypothetical protein
LFSGAGVAWGATGSRESDGNSFSALVQEKLVPEEQFLKIVQDNRKFELKRSVLTRTHWDPV